MAAAGLTLVGPQTIALDLRRTFLSEFVWPAVRDGAMTLNRAQFEALFAGLDWRKVRALEARPPTAAE